MGGGVGGDVITVRVTEGGCVCVNVITVSVTDGVCVILFSCISTNNACYISIFII